MKITQFLNLLKLPKEEQNYILKYEKETFITERTIRKGDNLCQWGAKIMRTWWGWFYLL
ncbi:MAG: hypothetical protein J7K71_04945 [Candidatus Omnitrophica bacterium]|nr:hypothetical protein [Candidatus Omnitrophota bacterium]